MFGKNKINVDEANVWSCRIPDYISNNLKLVNNDEIRMSTVPVHVSSQCVSSLFLNQSMLKCNMHITGKHFVATKICQNKTSAARPCLCEGNPDIIYTET